jgi:ABC-type transport system involved in multi-copper enzyme maturation permease subunit
MNNRIYTIAKNTFRETIRDRILLSVLVVMIAIIFFSLFVASISLEQSTRVVLDFGVTAIYILQMFVAIFIGSMLMYKEIERKTFYLLLPKPVGRGEVLIGKCLGLSFTTLIVTLLSTCTLYAVLFIQGGKLFFFPILLSALLSSLEAMLLILISLFFSTITSPILSAISTLAFFLVGHAGTIFRAIFMTTKSALVEWVTKTLYYLLPNFEKFNIRNDIVYGALPNGGQILSSLLYALAYAVLLLVITQEIFKRKDF